MSATKNVATVLCNVDMVIIHINRKSHNIRWFTADFFARGLHTRTAVARLALHQLGFLVTFVICRQQNVERKRYIAKRL